MPAKKFAEGDLNDSIFKLPANIVDILYFPNEDLFTGGEMALKQIIIGYQYFFKL